MFKGRNGPWTLPSLLMYTLCKPSTSSSHLTPCLNESCTMYIPSALSNKGFLLLYLTGMNLTSYKVFGAYGQNIAISDRFGVSCFNYIVSVLIRDVNTFNDATIVLSPATFQKKQKNMLLYATFSLLLLLYATFLVE